MCHEILTQRTFFCHHVQYKEDTLIQHFVTHVVPPLVCVHVRVIQSISVVRRGVLNKHVSNILSFATLCNTKGISTTLGCIIISPPRMCAVSACA